MLIAVAKWIGTLAPTLLLGVVSQFNIYVILPFFSSNMMLCSHISPL